MIEGVPPIFRLDEINQVGLKKCKVAQVYTHLNEVHFFWKDLFGSAEIEATHYLEIMDVNVYLFCNGQGKQFFFA